MFGLEDKKPKGLFEYDLEKELLSDKKKCQEMLDNIGKEKQILKNLLRTGIEKAEFENGGIILQGLDALEIVVTKINKKK